jgi:VIT1/CCC1 family predicted Fe2+/Mn2+ transporter
MQKIQADFSEAPIAMRSPERHRTERIGWLRAAVLGANDGIVSTASLLVGIASSQAPRENILLAGIAGLVAGAVSMAAGEFVSVSSQADTEFAEIARERHEIESNRDYEVEELTIIYVERGLEANLARQVAVQLMEHDAVGAHARDELGISESLGARPIQAAFTSAASFTVGASIPLSIVLFSPVSSLVLVISSVSLICLACVGMLAAYTGGSSMTKGAVRVRFWGALAMGLTALIGSVFGTFV